LYQGGPIILLSSKAEGLVLLRIPDEQTNPYCAFEHYCLIIQKHKDSTKLSKNRIGLAAGTLGSTEKISVAQVDWGIPTAALRGNTNGER
jgi:hypothetical protein